MDMSFCRETKGGPGVLRYQVWALSPSGKLLYFCHHHNGSFFLRPLESFPQGASPPGLLPRPTYLCSRPWGPNLPFGKALSVRVPLNPLAQALLRPAPPRSMAVHPDHGRYPGYSLTEPAYPCDCKPHIHSRLPDQYF